VELKTLIAWCDLNLFPFIFHTILLTFNSQAVIVHPDDIHLLTKLRSCVVQQYYNHDANFYKVYVIDGDVMVFKRASLPNIDIPIIQQGTTHKRSFEDTLSTAISTSLTTVDISEEMSPVRKKTPPHGMFCSVEFDSQRPYPTISKFLGTDEVGGVEVERSKLDASSTQSTVRTMTTPCKQSVIGGTDTTNNITITPSLSTSDCNMTPSSWKLNTVAASPLTISSARSTNSSKPCKHKKGQNNNINNNTTSTPIDTQTIIDTECSDESKTTCTNITNTHENNNNITATNTTASICCTDSDLNAQDIESHMTAFRASAAAIQDEFGLSLFGFDVIIPTSVAPYAMSPSDSLDNSVHSNYSTQSTQSDIINTTTQAPQIVVIDVNYFPSYKEVKDFPSRLKGFLRKVANEGRKNDTTSEMR
jgi:hypothetical protein